jgi:hypothetical protein
VRLQLGKGPGALPRAVAEDARHRQARVVVQHAQRHLAEEGKRRVVPVAERLGRLRRISLHETGVRVRQVEAEEMDLPLLAPDHRHRLAEIGLPMPGRMGQRDKHLPPLQPPLPDIGLHDRLAAREAVLGLEPLKDAPRRVPLLARPRPVLLQDPVNDAGEPIQLGPHRWFAAPVARRHRKPQHLRHRLRVDPKLPRRLPLAHPLHMTGTPNPRIQIHSLHPSGLPSAIRTKG